MKSRYLVMAVATVVLPWFACADEPAPGAGAKVISSRWQICQTVSGASYAGKPGNRSENTILLDTETGKTWLLWPTKDTPSGYSWIELTQRSDAPKVPVPTEPEPQ